MGYTNVIFNNYPTTHHNATEDIKSSRQGAWALMIGESVPNNSGGGDLLSRTLSECRIRPVARFFIAEQVDLIIRAQLQQVTHDLRLANSLQDAVITDIQDRYFCQNRL